MLVFIEEKKYRAEELSVCLDDRYFTTDLHGSAKIPYVGYFYNAEKETTVIILPKVFAEFEDKLQDDFLFSITVWLYLAIKQFNHRKKENTISDEATVREVTANVGRQRSSELEIILSLLKFNKENKSLFTFIKKNNNSSNRKVNWTKTVARQQPFLNKAGNPVYTRPVTKSKTMQVDEELICIFFSVLADLQQEYKFKTYLNPAYEIMRGRAYERFKTKALRCLKAIKNKYYSDKFLKLWHLCYAYFSRKEEVKAGREMNEMLLVRDFNIVFEDMIDALLGENKLPKALKEHKDGKRIDHIYPYRSLISDDSIYYIGDSKYYKNDAEFEQKSIYKQYTYAKNVIQYNIDLFNKGNLPEEFKYRDDLTEGYNITPNFFISAVIDENFDAVLDSLRARGKAIERNIHFKNRLFDRDTLHLIAYDINFLFVLQAYISRNHKMRETFSKKAKQLFRKDLVSYLNSNYDFYTVEISDGLERFVDTHFRLLNGKMYRPAEQEDVLLIALECGEEFPFSTEDDFKIKKFLIS